MNLISLVRDIFKPAADLIDAVHTSTEEKLDAKAKMLEIQVGFLEHALDFETKALEAKQAIIMAETKSESWVTRNWRPMTMLWFVGLIGAYWLGLTPESVSEEAVLAMFSLVKIGLGGYIVGRSAEKVVPGIITAMKKKERV